MKRLVAAALLAAVSSATALAQSRDEPAEPEPTASACPSCGMVTAIRPMPLRAEPQWMGTISGTGTARQPSIAIGAGRTAPPMVGSAPLPGQDGDLGSRHRTVYEVVVLMEDKSTRKLHYEHRPALSVGDRVRVSGGQVYLR